MYLRRNRRIKDGKEHCYWNIVESKRCSGGKVVQRQVLYLGEINDGLSRRSFAQWESEALALRGRFGKQQLAVPGPLSVEQGVALISEAETQVVSPLSLASISLAPSRHAAIASRQSCSVSFSPPQNDEPSLQSQRFRHLPSGSGPPFFTAGLISCCPPLGERQRGGFSIVLRL